MSVLCFAKNKEYKCLLEKLSNLEITYSTETEKLRSDVERLRMSEEEAKNATNRVITLQEEIAKLRKELHQTQSEKKTIEERADKYKHETEQASVRCMRRFVGTSCQLRFCPGLIASVAWQFYSIFKQCSTCTILSRLDT